MKALLGVLQVLMEHLAAQAAPPPHAPALSAAGLSSGSGSSDPSGGALLALAAAQGVHLRLAGWQAGVDAPVDDRCWEDALRMHGTCLSQVQPGGAQP